MILDVKSFSRGLFFLLIKVFHILIWDIDFCEIFCSHKYFETKTHVLIHAGYHLFLNQYIIVNTVSTHNLMTYLGHL